MRLSDRVTTDLGRRAARAVGADDYDRFLTTLRSLVDEFRGTRRGASP